MSKPPVILYGYDASPYATKVKNLLLVKKIPYQSVDVFMLRVRPELSELLGIGYRRIPVLAIGNDVYCDTALIGLALERQFPASEGYGTLFPPRKGGGKADTGLVKALTTSWVDKIVFPLGAQSLPWGRFDAAFLADRSDWQGAKIDPVVLAASQSIRTSALISHLGLLEEQLSDDREWLMDTEQPGLADISVHFVFDWVKAFKSLKDIYDAKAFPKTLTWLARVTDYLAKARTENVAPVVKITGEEAAQIVCSSPRTDIETSTGFNEAEAGRLGLKLGQTVAVSPTDTGKIPTVGSLVALSREETVIEVRGTAGTARCHFPRLEFAVVPAAQRSKM